MDYVTLVIATIVFFASFAFFVLAWSKKPSKGQVMELKEAGEEIAKQIQEATEESILLLEDKIAEMEKRCLALEEDYRQKVENDYREKRIEMEQLLVEQKSQQVVNKVKQQKEQALFDLDEKDEKMKRILQLHKQGYGMTQIAKEMNMNIGVVQVYVNLLKMNKIG